MRNLCIVLLIVFASVWGYSLSEQYLVYCDDSDTQVYYDPVGSIYYQVVSSATPRSLYCNEISGSWYSQYASISVVRYNTTINNNTIQNTVAGSGPTTCRDGTTILSTVSNSGQNLTFCLYGTLQNITSCGSSGTLQTMNVMDTNDTLAVCFNGLLNYTLSTTFINNITYPEVVPDTERVPFLISIGVIKSDELLLTPFVRKPGGDWTWDDEKSGPAPEWIRSMWNQMDNSTATQYVISDLYLRKNNTSIVETPNTTLKRVVQFNACGDGKCNKLYETCLTCPQDCPSCSYDSYKVTVYPNIDLTDSPVYLGFVNAIDLSLLPLNKMRKFSVKWEGHFIPKSVDHTIHISATSGGVRCNITTDDGAFVQPMNALTYMSSINSTKSIKLNTRNTYKITVEYFGMEKKMLKPDIQLYTSQDSPQINIFNSLNMCGDTLCDVREDVTGDAFECARDCAPATESGVKLFGCGDDVCSREENEDYISCPRDCYGKDLNCSSTPFSASNPLGAGIATGDDTIGYLIRNQKMYRLPGVEHLIYGLNPITGDSASLPLFDIQFCDDKNIVQDNYRQMVFQIPEGFHCTPYPTCSFSTSTSTFATSSDVSKQQAEESGMNAELKLGFRFFGFGGSLEASYSQSKASKTASKVKISSTSSVGQTQAKCFSSKVILERPPLSRSFLNDVNSMTDNGILTCRTVVERYGAFYYKNAEMGGYVEQYSSMISSASDTSSSSDYNDQMAASLSASVGGWGFSASASGGYNSALSKTDSKQDTFDSSSKRTTVYSYGGIAGSFGPELTTSWSQWAETVDLLPVPVNYKVGLIYNLIPREKRTCWMNGLSNYMANPDLTNKPRPPMANIITISFSNADPNIMFDTGTLYFRINGNMTSQTVFKKFTPVNNGVDIPITVESGGIYQMRVEGYFGSITSIDFTYTDIRLRIDKISISNEKAGEFNSYTTTGSHFVENEVVVYRYNLVTKSKSEIWVRLRVMRYPLILHSIEKHQIVINYKNKAVTPNILTPSQVLYPTEPYWALLSESYYIQLRYNYTEQQPIESIQFIAKGTGDQIIFSSRGPSVDSSTSTVAPFRSILRRAVGGTPIVGTQYPVVIDRRAPSETVHKDSYTFDLFASVQWNAVQAVSKVLIIRNAQNQETNALVMQWPVASKISFTYCMPKCNQVPAITTPVTTFFQPGSDDIQQDMVYPPALISSVEIIHTDDYGTAKVYKDLGQPFFLPTNNLAAVYQKCGAMNPRLFSQQNRRLTCQGMSTADCDNIYNTLRNRGEYWYFANYDQVLTEEMKTLIRQACINPKDDLTVAVFPNDEEPGIF